MDSTMIIVIIGLIIAVAIAAVIIWKVVTGKKGNEEEPSILDVQSNGVPSDAEKDTFSYGYEKEPTIAMNPVDPNAVMPNVENVSETPAAEVPSTPETTVNEAVQPEPVEQIEEVKEETPVASESIPEATIANESNALNAEVPETVNTVNPDIPVSDTPAEIKEEPSKAVNLQPRASIGTLGATQNINVNMAATQPIPDLVEEQKKEAEAEAVSEVPETTESDFEEKPEE